MKYLIRAVKYLIYFALLFCIITLTIALLMKHDITQFSGLFQEGSLPKIIILFTAVAAVYPAFGFKKNRLVLDDKYEAYRDVILETMKEADYKLVEDTAEKMVFRSNKTSIRISRMWEDTITFTPKDESEALVDGPYKDTLRFIRTIYYKYRMAHPKNYEEQ